MVRQFFFFFFFLSNWYGAPLGCYFTFDYSVSVHEHLQTPKRFFYLFFIFVLFDCAIAYNLLICSY